ncbi:MAG: glutamate 5-kinase [Candidatus Methanofastidiosa archaeon]|nr:glutamate 5-kinase [Candidatus Methanofastidiosa archaeon]
MILVARNAGIYVIKLGTSLITDVNTNEIRIETLNSLTDQIARIKDDKSIVIVSSGAIGLGLHSLGELRRPKEMAKKQAAAAVGQNILMNLYEKLFNKRQITIAQVLLTKDGISEEKGYINARNTIQTLLDYGVIPIINENDTIATEEIQFGDNDNLASYVAELVQAEMLILLTDTDGLYTGDPTIYESAKKFEIITEITEEICNSANGTKGACSVGGMQSKIEAAKRALASNVPVMIASGFEKDVLFKIYEGKKCGTLFLPKGMKIDE